MSQSLCYRRLIATADARYRNHLANTRQTGAWHDYLGRKYRLSRCRTPRQSGKARNRTDRRRRKDQTRETRDQTNGCVQR